MKAYGNCIYWIEQSGLEHLYGNNVLCSCARHFTLTVPLSTQVYKWVPADLMLGGNPVMDQHPIQGEQKYSQSLYAHIQTLPFPCIEDGVEDFAIAKIHGDFVLIIKLLSHTSLQWLAKLRQNFNSKISTSHARIYYIIEKS